MKLTVIRHNLQDDYTSGILLIDDYFECYTLEDEQRAVKVWGETCVPDGVYEITLRTEGSFHNRFKKKFPDFHKGMLWVRNVPNFEYILIHIGNTDKDTAGCLLVGNVAHANKNYIGSSTDAYKKMYKKVLAAFERGEKVTIEYKSI